MLDKEIPYEQRSDVAILLGALHETAKIFNARKERETLYERAINIARNLRFNAIHGFHNDDIVEESQELVEILEELEYWMR